MFNFNPEYLVTRKLQERTRDTSIEQHHKTGLNSYGLSIRRTGSFSSAVHTTSTTRSTRTKHKVFF